VIGVEQNDNGNMGEVPRAFVVLKIEEGEKGIMPPKMEKHYFDHIEEKIRQFANGKNLIKFGKEKIFKIYLFLAKNLMF
jgi:hypothetical protein